jgi:hypothetical protein
MTVVAAAVLMAAAPNAAAASEGAGPTSEGCPRVVLYFSRGSGQPLGGVERGLPEPGLQVYDDLAQRYEPGFVGSMANAYTAVGLTFSVGRLSLLNPFIPVSYRESVANGVQAVDQNVADLMGLCPRTWLVLGGYSQGAHVIRTALGELSELEREHVLAVVLFGDPYFSASEPNVQALSTFNPGQSGILRQLPGPGAPAIEAAYSGRVFSWCHLHDVVCQGWHRGNRWASHKTYDEDAEAASADVAARIAAVGLAPGLAGGSGPAAATPYRYRVSGTCAAGTCALAEWSGPGTSSFTRVGAAYEGQEVAVACQAEGQTMTSTSGQPSAIWDELGSGAFVSDLYLNTPNVGRYSPPLPQCKSLSVDKP